MKRASSQTNRQTQRGRLILSPTFVFRSANDPSLNPKPSRCVQAVCKLCASCVARGGGGGGGAHLVESAPAPPAWRTRLCLSRLLAVSPPARTTGCLCLCLCIFMCVSSFSYLLPPLSCTVATPTPYPTQLNPTPTHTHLQLVHRRLELNDLRPLSLRRVRPRPCRPPPICLPFYLVVWSRLDYELRGKPRRRQRRHDIRCIRRRVATCRPWSDE